MGTRLQQFRIVLLGEAAVGKTSFVLRFVEGKFFDRLESTIGAAFSTQTVSVDGQEMKFEIWDTAGQERYHSLAPMYYRGAQAAVIVYDITERDSFLRAKAWVSELQKQGNPTTATVIALAGNKADLENRRSVAFEEARSYAEDNGFIFRETSAKTGQNVSDVFLQIARKMPKGVTSQDDKSSGRSRRLNADGTEDRKEGCC